MKPRKAKRSFGADYEYRAVANLKRQLNHSDHVRLEYSDVLTRLDFSRLELINSVDGWHPSVEGHKVLADTAFNALHPSVLFLGIGTKPTKKPGFW